MQGGLAREHPEPYLSGSISHSALDTSAVFFRGITPVLRDHANRAFPYCRLSTGNVEPAAEAPTGRRPNRRGVLARRARRPTFPPRAIRRIQGDAQTDAPIRFSRPAARFERSCSTRSRPQSHRLSGFEAEPDVLHATTRAAGSRAEGFSVRIVPPRSRACFQLRRARYRRAVHWDAAATSRLLLTPPPWRRFGVRRPDAGYAALVGDNRNNPNPACRGFAARVRPQSSCRGFSNVASSFRSSSENRATPALRTGHLSSAGSTPA